jgi:lipopolysaccharide/colanic/teichoic acid biosynthesis glycosyltransferase
MKRSSPIVHSVTAHVPGPGRAGALPPERGPAWPAAPVVAPVPRRWHDALSWPLQVVVSVAALVALSPLLVLIAAAVKLSTRGPLLYRGVRVGRNLRPFIIYKFRTMVPDAETRIGARLLSAGDKVDLCTPVGRILKRTKLDELPQLLNVIKGEMRLVGPRPVRPVFLDESRRDIPGYDERFAVPPGVTGIAQLRGGYYTPPRNKLRYDRVYIRRRSFRLDFQLVLLTLVKILDRWLNAGLIALTVFLFASFIPVELHPLLRVPQLGLRIDVVQVALVVAATALFVRRGRREFFISRSPLTLTVALFAGVSALDAGARLVTGRGPGAGTVALLTGLAIAFLIANTLTSRMFVNLTIRTIAVTSVVMALVGLFQAFVLADSAATSSPEYGQRALETYTRVSSMLGSPVALAVYLVLGIPLLLAEVMRARTQHARDLWLVCATVTVLAVFFTQTRMALVALLVAGIWFFARRPVYAAGFASAIIASCLILVASGLPRFAPDRMVTDVGEWTTKTVRALRVVSRQAWVLGEPEVLVADVAPAALASDGAALRAVRTDDVANTHLRLIIERGLVGWVTVMWLTVATIMALRRVSRRIAGDDLVPVLWAIAASLAGFLVSMNSKDTFASFPVQVFFWSLIGIGLGLVAQLDGWRRNLIWRFGDAGD